MAIAFRQFTQIAAGGTTGASTISAPALPTGTTSGDMVLLCVIVKYASTTMTDPSGWTVVTNNQANNTGLTDSGNDAGNIRAAIYFREYDGVWAMPSITLSGGANVTMRGAISYSKGGSEAWQTPVCANAVDNSASSVGVDPAASGTTISLASGDMFGSFAAQNGDVGTFSAHNCTVSGVTFGTQNARLAAASTTGTDLRGHSIDKLYSSGTAGAGPDGALVMTSGGGSDAGVMIFYRLRVGTTVAATMVAACGTLGGTITATVTQPIAAVLAAPMGTLSAAASATVVPRIEATLVAPLGGLAATTAATVSVPATLVAPLGALSATATARRTLPAVLASSCGGLTATMAATPSTPSAPTVDATLNAPLGGLAATATATRQHPVTAVAACGALTATAAATIQHSASGAAPLGALVATMNATAGVATEVDAVLVADLGQLVAMANAGPPPRQSTFFPFHGRHDHPWEDVVRFAEGWPA